MISPPPQEISKTKAMEEEIPTNTPAISALAIKEFATNWLEAIACTNSSPEKREMNKDDKPTFTKVQIANLLEILKNAKKNNGMFNVKYKMD